MTISLGETKRSVFAGWAVWRKETKRKLLFGGCNSVSVLSLKIDGKLAGQELK
jgi:hypothetical protein